jgi:hypothetical protein
MKRALAAILLIGVLPGCESSVTAPALPPPPTPTTGPETTPPAANQEPTLAIKVHPHRGPAPLDVNVNMCRTTDPDGDPLTFEYKWGGTYKAFFCVDDGNDHEVCDYELIVVG